MADGVKQRVLALPGASGVEMHPGEAVAANLEQRDPGAGPKQSDRVSRQAEPAARLVGVTLGEPGPARTAVDGWRQGGAREAA